MVRSLIASLGALGVVLLLAACGSTNVVDGGATSMLFDPDRVGGLPAAQGDSGPRPDAGVPSRDADNTDGGPIDELAMLGVEDIEEFWSANYDRFLPGEFVPVENLMSYDSTDPAGPLVCGGDVYDMPNAFFCSVDDMMAWDRAVFMPVASDYFGEMSVVGVMAHEYGHALSYMSGLVNDDTPTLVWEQQADCFAGVYMRWVAAGDSPRFQLSTGDGLNHVLAGMIYGRDALSTEPSEDAHGSALERVSAFQMGFAGSADQCVAIDETEIEERRGDLPQYVSTDDYGDAESVDAPIEESTLESLMSVLDTHFGLAEPPTLSYDTGPCAGTEPTEVSWYCPDTNTVHVDMPALQALGAAKDEDNEGVLLQGDNTALSIVTSRYALAAQRERGADIDTTLAAVRTVCLTGTAQNAMTESDAALTLSPGDTDEAVAGLLTNGIAASDVNGYVVPAGFTRIIGYRLGLSGQIDDCFERFV